MPKLRTPFAEMQSGTDFAVILNKKLLRFNGGLIEDASILPVGGTQLGILIKAVAMQWKDVEPALLTAMYNRRAVPKVSVPTTRTDEHTSRFLHKQMADHWKKAMDFCPLLYPLAPLK